MAIYYTSNALSLGIACAAIDSSQGALQNKRVANDHADIAKPCESNKVIRRSASAARACKRGSCVNRLVAKAHAVLEISCVPMSVLILIA